MNTSTRVFRIIAVASFAVLTAGVAPMSIASDSSDALQVKVGYTDLNVSSTSGATTLYNRIKGAANAVCRPFHPSIPSDLRAAEAFSTCMQKAMNKAIKDVNDPALFTVANAKAGTAKLVMLASGQVR